jgi:hypothetical protein
MPPWLTLTITILVVFITSMVATILQRRALDPCLKKMRNCLVYCQLKSERWIWGSLQVYSKSLEFVYPTPNQDQAGHQELSYLLFEDMLPQVHIVLRPLPKENTMEYRLWRKELDKMISPSFWLNIRRSFRNFWNTVRDAFSQSIGIVITQLRSRNPAAMLAQADQKLVSTSQMLAGYGNNAYEPILEKYLGKEVVIEILSREKWVEHVGILEEYSEKYILIRNITPNSELVLPPGLAIHAKIDVIFPRAHSVVRHLASLQKQ